MAQADCALGQSEAPPDPGRQRDDEGVGPPGPRWRGCLPLPDPSGAARSHRQGVPSLLVALILFLCFPL